MARVMVVFGGRSGEHEVSLASARAIMQALNASGRHEVVPVGITRGGRWLSSGDPMRELESAGSETTGTSGPPAQTEEKIPAALGTVDVVFPVLHGPYGEDGTIQGMLELLQIPYTGSGVLASALAMDKDLSKHLFRRSDVQTADWVMVSNDDPGSFAIEHLGLPLIVKPSKQGSTVGLTLVKERGELPASIAEAFRYDDEVMVEQFIAGREFTVGILGDEALPVGEIIPKHEIYDYECKYTAGMAQEIFPARISEAWRDRLQDEARRAFKALKLGGYARIDFRMTEDGEPYCLEANTLPGMTQTSLIPQAAAAAGISFPELCDRIVRIALESGRGPKGGDWVPAAGRSAGAGRPRPRVGRAAGKAAARAAVKTPASRKRTTSTKTGAKGKREGR